MNTSKGYAIFDKHIEKDQHKIIINLDKDLSLEKETRLVKKVLCLFTDSENNPISLSKNTSAKFHVLLQLHAGHSFHHYNYNLGKKKFYFT